MSQFMIFGIFIALVIVMIFYRKHQEKKRSQELERSALKLGFKFELTTDEFFLNSFKQLPVFNSGHSRKAKNRIYKEKQDYQVDLFGYQYTTSNGKNSSTHRFTIAGFQNPENSFPSFELRPQNFLHSIGKKFGYQDIDFSENKTFSDNMLLRGSDEQAIRKLFHPKLLKQLENEDKLCVEAIGEQIIFYRQYKRLKPEKINAFYQKTEKLYRSFCEGINK